MESELSTLFDPRQAALVIVDVQNDFCHEDGITQRSGIDRSTARSMVPRLKQFITEAETVDLPIVYIRNLNDDWSMSPSWRARNTGYLGTICRRGTWGAEFYELSPRPQDAIVEKYRYSAFCDTNLALYLRSRGIETVMVSGVSTNVCVETTARDAFCRDFNVILVEDCCAARTAADHESAVHNVRRFFGMVATSREIAASWAQSGRLATASANR